MMDEPEVDFVSRVGGAILLAETQWTPKAGVSKERAMALAAIEAMREPTKEMILKAETAVEDHKDGGVDSGPDGEGNSSYEYFTPGSFRFGLP
jgi:hypothetical protein